jgi:uncharacterized protein (DUF924 family)
VLHETPLLYNALQYWFSATSTHWFNKGYPV